MGGADIETFTKLGANFVALADVDEARAAGTFKAHPTARRYRDFREMIEKEAKNIDAVTVGTPDHILFKPGKLDPDERVIMEQHATIGAQILARSASMVEGMSYLSLGSEIAGGHHEHFDGNGYPRKLKGQEIPLSARIVAVVDVFDALLNKRPYKEPWTLHDTMDYISGRAGSQFDPEVVRALEALVKERRLQDLPDE
jgi:response regulator RpfG family c-di-GMP phosphodiesterase